MVTRSCPTKLTTNRAVRIFFSSFVVVFFLYVQILYFLLVTAASLVHRMRFFLNCEEKQKSFYMKSCYFFLISTLITCGLISSSEMITISNEILQKELMKNPFLIKKGLLTLADSKITCIIFQLKIRFFFLF